MAIIQKRADELKPGDVISGEDKSSLGKRIVVDAFPASSCDDQRIVIDAFSVKQRFVDRYWIDPDTEVAVEAPDFTLAQQHAEDMLWYVEEFAKHLAGEQLNWGAHFKENMQELLDKIRPPEPPTLEEALAALDEITRAAPLLGLDDQRPVVNHAAGIVARARRAGVMP